MERAGLLPADDARVEATPVSFEELYDRHRLDIYRYLRAWGSSEDESADLTASTFERAYRAMATPPAPDASRAWLVRIARNLAIDSARRRDAARRGLRFWPRNEVAPDPADLLIRDETDRLLAERVRRLPTAQREAGRSRLHHPADDPNFERLYDEDQRRKISAWPDPATLPLVAQDQRGEVILAFFTDGHIYADCTIQQDGERGYGAIGLGELEGGSFGLLRVVGGMTAEGSPDGVPPLRSVIGEAAPEVASVIIEREEGEPVTATVSGGYFLAWWPSSADIVRITAYDSDGNALGSIQGSD